MEPLWSPAHLLLLGPSLSQRERQRKNERDGGEEEMRSVGGGRKWRGRGRVRQGWKKERGC